MILVIILIVVLMGVSYGMQDSRKSTPQKAVSGKKGKLGRK